MATPGIYTDAHVNGWRKVTDAVHKAGGHLYIQLMHAGRTGIRLSSLGNSGGLDEGPEAAALYGYLVKELNKLNLAYLHILHTGNEDLLRDIRAA